MNLGFDVKALLPRADVVLVLDAPVPWVPKAVSPGRDAKIIHISPDPLQTQYPFRDFEADLLITGTTRGALPLLRESLRKRMKRDDIETRRKAIARVARGTGRRAAPRARRRAGAHADLDVAHRRLPQRAENRGRHHHQRAWRADQPAPADQAGQLHGQPLGRRARFRARRGAWRQARRARSAR